MILIVDYGVGNLRSVAGALAHLGLDARVSDDPAALETAGRAILPGVGAFAEAMATLRARGWDAALREAVRTRGMPLLGVCLGMQLLATAGEEGGETPGLGLIPGRVRRLDALGCRERIPHVGWNAVAAQGARHPLFAGVPDGTLFYFVHSYALETDDPADTRALARHGATFAAAVGRGAVVGTQFHPEKSSKAGMALLRNFAGMAPCSASA